MTKKIKIIMNINLIFWLIAAISILLGFIFTFLLSKGVQGGTNSQNLEDIGNTGSKAVGGILIAASVGITAIAMSIAFTKLRKEAGKPITIIASVSFLVGIVMTIMSILDIASIWSIWPWLINFIFMIGFAIFYSINKQIRIKNRFNSSENKLKIVGKLHTEGILNLEEYESIKRRIIFEHNKLNQLKEESSAQKIQKENSIQKTHEEQIESPANQIKEEKKQIKEQKKRIKEEKKQIKSPVHQLKEEKKQMKKTKNKLNKIKRKKRKE
ncbi:hypothetical protein MYMA111404_02115 [Mycoplasma marinum]|uniref:hypothetical protein n=1 Tax=Mycoplasma marinum TaxID=1937190 RepID=UPI0010399A5E|nr:hypothetical protein [Mycoplasma marinum]